MDTNENAVFEIDDDRLEQVSGGIGKKKKNPNEPFVYEVVKASANNIIKEHHPKDYAVFCSLMVSVEGGIALLLSPYPAALQCWNELSRDRKNQMYLSAWYELN